MALVLLYAVPGLLLWAAAWLSGGHPRPDLWNWPAVAAASFMRHRPFAPWTWVGASQILSPVLFYAVCAAVVLLLLLAAVVAYSVMQGGIIAWSPNVLRSRAAPARLDRRQLRRLRVRGPEPERMILGQRGPALIASAPGESLLVLGPAGSGKTSAFSVPIIQDWSGPVIAAGLGRETVDATAGVRQRRGRVDIYDPAGVTNLATRAWSPVAGCEVMEVAVRRAGWMLPCLPREAGQGAGDQDETPAGALLAVTLWAGAHAGATVGQLRDWLRDPACRLLRAAVTRIRPPDPRALRCLGALARMSTRDRVACCGMVEALLAGAGADAPGAPAAGADFDPGDFLKGAGGDATVYVVAPPEEPQRTASATSALLGALLDEALGLARTRPGHALDRPLLVVLDGTAATAPVRELGRYLAIAGRFNVTLLVTFEDLADAERGYGELADDLIAAAQVVVMLGTQRDERTLQLMGDLARRWPADGGSRPRVAPRRPARIGELPESARLLGPGQALLLSERLPPFLLWTRPWHEAARLVELARSRPYLEGIGWAEVIPDPGPDRRSHGATRGE